MKKLLLLIFIVLSLLTVSCNKKTAKNENSKPIVEENSQSITKEENIVKNNGIQVLYFHSNRRCYSCVSVESVTSEAVREYYGDKVNFKSIDIEDEKYQNIVQGFQISGQRLLILKGENGFDLTYFAFMNAAKNPDKLKHQIKVAVDSCYKM